MGTNIAIQKLLESINTIVEGVLEELGAWDGTMEHGISIIDKIQNDLDEFKTLSIVLRELYSDYEYDEEYKVKLNTLLNNHNKLTQALKVKQNNLLDSMQQLNKRNLVENNYISVKMEPVFIDKDVL